MRSIKKYIISAFLGLQMLLAIGVANSQDLTLKLSDKTELKLYEARLEDKPYIPYYYLPVNLRLSKDKEGNPEFSMLSYRESDGSTTKGGIMHLLLVWGLTETQEKEAQSLLKSTVDSSAVLMSAISLESPNPDLEFEICSDGKVAEILRKSIKSQGRIPLSPGSKMAISFHFDGADTDYILQKFNEKNGFKEVTIRMQFSTSSYIRASGYDPGPGPFILEAKLEKLFDVPEIKNSIKQY